MNVHSMLRLMTRHKPKNVPVFTRSCELDMAGIRISKSAQGGFDSYLHSFPSCCGIAILHCLPENYDGKERFERFRKVVETTKRAAKAEGTSLILAVTSEEDQSNAGDFLRKASFKRVITQHNPKSGGSFALWMCNLWPENEDDDPDEEDDE